MITIMITNTVMLAIILNEIPFVLDSDSWIKSANVFSLSDVIKKNENPAKVLFTFQIQHFPVFLA